MVRRKACCDITESSSESSPDILHSVETLYHRSKFCQFKKQDRWPRLMQEITDGCNMIAAQNNWEGGCVIYDYSFVYFMTKYTPLLT